MPLVGKHISNEPGETVMIDIAFLEGNDMKACPVLIMVCPLTRYVMCEFVKNLNAIALVSVFIVNWIAVFSYPKLALSDQGECSQGKIWEQFCSFYSASMSSVPRESPNQIGACENNPT